MEDTMTKQKNDTTLDLREKANRLKAEIERMLIESHGEVTEEINEKMNQLNDLFPEVADKIESLRWAKMKVEAQKKGAEAIVDFYKGEAKKEKKTVSARDNNIEHIKNMVLMNLNTLESRDIRLSDGKKVYIREFFSANIEDEAAAWSDLQGTDMAEKQAVLSDGGLDQVKDAILCTLENIQTTGGEPVDFPSEVHTKLMEAMKMLKGAEVDYSFDKRALNKEVQRLHEERREKIEPVLGEMQGVSEELRKIEGQMRPDEQESEEQQALQAKAEKLREELEALQETADQIDEDYGISGVTYDINESVFGL